MASDERAEQRKRAELAKEISGNYGALLLARSGQHKEKQKRVWGFQTSDYE